MVEHLCDCGKKVLELPEITGPYLNGFWMKKIDDSGEEYEEYIHGEWIPKVTCDMCENNFDKNLTFLHCKECLYDICSDCKKSIS